MTSRAKQRKHMQNHCFFGGSWRRLVQRAYLPDVAGALKSLGAIYRETRLQEADEVSTEAEQILEPFWRANPEMHGDEMARISLLKALVKERKLKEQCQLALLQRALAIAINPFLRETIQGVINRSTTV
jgi:hypothetical protein